jgi:hypothetical protein
MEFIVAEVDTVQATQSAICMEADQPIQEPHEEYTLGDFLRQFGSVIAICLGLATLAHLAVFMAGD